ncbi:MAG: 1-acyl-sn-glycerol-3-phosphate acyltransferase [Kiloniellales bacterium]
MPPVIPYSDQLTADELLSVVGNLVDELHPRRRRRFHITLDSDLDRDLGFDSLGRGELLLRLEQAFKLHLPERRLGEAATPRDLLEAVLAAKAPGAPSSVPEVTAPELEPAAAAPASAQTLTEVLDWHVAVHPSRPHALLAAPDGTQQPPTYRELAETARVVARGLRARGVEEGDRVAIMLPSGAAFFAAKAELTPQTFAGPFLCRIGTLFVERWTPERGVEQTREAAALAAQGARLVFFPEGTLSRTPGLGDFRLGAFVTAAEAGVPVVPIAIRGTRPILRGGQWFPRHGTASLTISAAIRPETAGFKAALKLRDAARAEILARCGEPDLAERPAPPAMGEAPPPARRLG